MLPTPVAQLPQSAMTPYPPVPPTQDVQKQLEDLRLMTFNYMFQSGLDHKAETVSLALIQDVHTPSVLRPHEGFLTVEKQQPRPVVTPWEYNGTKRKAERARECDTSPSQGDSLYQDQQVRGRVWDVTRRHSPCRYRSPSPSRHCRSTPETRRALRCDNGRDRSSDEDQDDRGHRELYKYCSPGQGEHCAYKVTIRTPVLHQEV